MKPKSNISLTNDFLSLWDDASMTLAIVHSRACVGVQAPPVTVEVHLSNGLPSFTLVGNIYL